MTNRRVLLTGATGFVGGRLWPALEEAGYSVRGYTRDAAKARTKHPDRDWAQGDVSDPAALREAMAGCDFAYYLVHGMAEGHGDFRRREVDQARTFAEAAANAGVKRIVYLGGFEPQGPPTEHLASRLEVGETLRAGTVPCIELRASMIVGKGSLSWLMVRDLAARLPVMILPSWLKSRTQPIAIEDVVVALVKALEIDLEGSVSFDLPGPEALTGKQTMELTAAVMGLPHARTIDVPVLSPWLSSHWVRFVTRADWSVAREVVLGLAHDFLARDGRYWQLIGHEELIPFPEAVRRALAEEAGDPDPEGFWGRVEIFLRRRSLARPNSSRSKAAS